jgi:hypothetical protein
MVDWGQMKKWAEDNGVPDDALVVMGSGAGHVPSYGDEVLNDLDMLEYAHESVYGKQEFILMFRRQGGS